jgi:alpha-tubulin suppressor-like RCC1 family protein
MYRILVAAAVVVLGSLVSVASPAHAASGPWSVVSAGEFHTCAINASKSLYCWGGNTSGQVGDGTVEQRLSPKRIGSSGAWASVAAGGAHTCAVSTGKSLYCWGWNALGQIGDGTDTNRLTPKRIGTSGAWASVAAGGLHTCAVTTGKSLYCWGFNQLGQVGDGTETTPRPSPRKVGKSGVWASVATGYIHTCAVSTGKSLYCWGDNDYGQIGDGTDTNRPSPKRIGTSGAWARVNAGGGSTASHTCATTTGKSLYCWGDNDHGQIGDGPLGTSPRLTPKKVGSSGVWASSTAGGYHGCAISTGKSLYCWGLNLNGQVGDGIGTTPRRSPIKVP